MYSRLRDRPCFNDYFLLPTNVISEEYRYYSKLSEDESGRSFLPKVRQHCKLPVTTLFSQGWLGSRPIISGLPFFAGSYEAALGSPFTRYTGWRGHP